MLEMTEREYSLFMQALNKWNKLYDPQAQMVKKPFSSPGYHTTLTGGEVHPLRDSLRYAVALLDSGREEYRLRAQVILEKVISLQDTDPSHATYGIWPWFLEEPLSQMAPPDWNWADFCGKELLQVALDHAERVPEIMPQVKQAIIHAAKSIIRRDVDPGYTNIAIMGTYVTMVAGECFGLEEILEYGRERLQKLHRYTMHHGSFTEYNSPTYTIVALEDLSRLRQHVQDPESLKLIAELNDLGWKTLAEHFHAPTWQWAGPHARSYNSLVNKSFLARLQLATEGEVHFIPESEVEIEIDWPRIKLYCPKEYRQYFRNQEPNRTLKEVFFKGDGQKPSRMATTYLTSAYALGTFDRSILWNQVRALIAYWGTQDKTTYLHLRCLHDGYDYCSAVLHNVQHEGTVLSMVNFAIDGGDTHPVLDLIKAGTVEAEDLRLRFEFGGAIDQVQLPGEWNKEVTVNAGDVVLDLQVPYCRFGKEAVQFSTGQEDGKVFLDLVFYQGERKAISLAALGEAVAVIGLRIHPRGDAQEKTEHVEVSFAGEGRVRANWSVGGKLLQLEADSKPQALMHLLQASRGTVDSITMDE